MKAVILAAGDNTRFRKVDNSHNKLVYPVLGMPLVIRTILSAKSAGIKEFVIVTGYQDSTVRKLLGNGERLGVAIDYVHNKSWRGENGISVYQASHKVNSSFILLMGDHLFSPQTLAGLKAIKLKNQEVVLAIDRKIGINADPNEATKVKLEQRAVIAIGKELKDYNALDTGMFLCSPYLFSVLTKTIARKKYYLTDAMRALAKEGKLKGYDIGESFWADIDNHQDLRQAQKRLFAHLVEPKNEGPVSKYINRRVSNLITKALLKTPLTPNQISLASFFLALFAGVLLTSSSYAMILLGALVVQLSSIIDGVDGEIARIKLSTSSFGAWFDTLLDRYADAAIVTGATIGVYTQQPSLLIIVIGFLALLGSVLSSYSSHTFQTAFGKSFSSLRTRGNRLRIPSGRDVRLFIIFICGILNLVLPGLLLIALLTHFAIFLRLLAFRNK